VRSIRPLNWFASLRQRARAAARRKTLPATWNQPFTGVFVAMDATTGAKWHFQSGPHGQWDMDSTLATMADVVQGSRGRVIYYGTKQGRTFVIDRI
jgi:glucose dehydrogenase